MKGASRSHPPTTPLTFPFAEHPLLCYVIQGLAKSEPKLVDHVVSTGAIGYAQGLRQRLVEVVKVNVDFAEMFAEWRFFACLSHAASLV